MARDMLEVRANELGRWEMKAVPRHFRERLNALARTMGCTQAEALAAFIQAGECAMSAATADLYVAELRRKLCIPEGETRLRRGRVDELQPLPELSTPIGIGMRRQELAIFEPSRGKTLTADHPAYAIAQARFAAIQQQTELEAKAAAAAAPGDAVDPDAASGSAEPPKGR